MMHGWFWPGSLVPHRMFPNLLPLPYMVLRWAPGWWFVLMCAILSILLPQVGWAGLLLPQVDGLFMLAPTLLQLTVLQITWQKTPNDLYPARHRPALHFSTDQSFLCLKYFASTTLISEIHRSIVSRTLISEINCRIVSQILISEIHCSIVSQIWQFRWRHLVTPCHCSHGKNALWATFMKESLYCNSTISQIYGV